MADRGVERAGRARRRRRSEQHRVGAIATSTRCSRSPSEIERRPDGDGGVRALAARAPFSRLRHRGAWSSAPRFRSTCSTDGACTPGRSQHRRYLTPSWAVAPFVGYLLLIATLPLFVGAAVGENRNKLILAIARRHARRRLSGRAPGRRLGQLLPRPAATTSRSWRCWARCSRSRAASACAARWSARRWSTPRSWPSGRVLASVIGTTGASALLIRPLLRANEHRARTTHLVVFFIFIVANAGGLLTPLGDPPLFLGFLRGVPVHLDAAPRARLGAGERRAAGAVRCASIRSRSRANARKPRPPRALRSRRWRSGRSGSKAPSTCSGCWASSASCS